MDAKVKRPLNELAATEIARKIAAGETTCEAVVRDCIARIAARDGVVKAWVNFDPRARARAGARARWRAEARPAARRADRCQRHHRHLRHADRDGLADLSRPSAARGCGVRRAAAPRRRGDPRQDRHLRIRRHGARRKPPIRTMPAHTPGGSSSGSAAGGRRSHGAGGARHPDRRLGAAADVVSAAFSATSRPTTPSTK